MHVLVSASSLLWARIFTGACQIECHKANYYRCLPICNGRCSCIWPFKEEYCYAERMVFPHATEKKKKSRIGLRSSCSSSTCQQGEVHSMFCSHLLPSATLEVTQHTPSPSAMGVQVPELLPSSGLSANHLLFQPCFYIERNLDLYTEKSYKLPKQKQTLSQHDGSFNFCKLQLGTLGKKKAAEAWHINKWQRILW